MSDKRYSKVEEEIIQILDRMEKESPAPSRPNLRLVHSKRARRRPRVAISRPRLSARSRPAWFWLALAFGLAFAAILVNDWSRTAALLLAILSVVSFLAPIVVERSSETLSGPTGPKTWRGQDITFDSGRSDFGSTRIGRWLERRRGGPRF